MRRVLGCGPTAVTGLSNQDGTGKNQTVREKKTVLSLLDLDQGGMTNLATQNKDMFAAKQFVQVRKQNLLIIKF